MLAVGCFVTGLDFVGQFLFVELRSCYGPYSELNTKNGPTVSRPADSGICWLPPKVAFQDVETTTIQRYKAKFLLFSTNELRLLSFSPFLTV